MSSNGNGDQGGDASDWHKADFDVVRDVREMEVNPVAPVDTFQDLGFATNRGSLPGEIAADIAFNPFSVYSTGGEKGAAIGQAILPGGLAVGALRTAMMTGKSPKGTGPPPGPDSQYFEDTSGAKKKPRPGGAKKAAPAARQGGAAPRPVVRPDASSARGSPTGGRRGILTSAYGDITTPQVSRKTLLGA